MENTNIVGTSNDFDRKIQFIIYLYMYVYISLYYNDYNKFMI